MVSDIKIKTIGLLLRSLKGTTDNMMGHPVQHENIENLINAIKSEVESD